MSARRSEDGWRRTPAGTQMVEMNGVRRAVGSLRLGERLLSDRQEWSREQAWVGYVQPQQRPDEWLGWCTIEHLGQRLRTGCVLERQPTGTFGLLVTRARPYHGVHALIHDAWPLLAPSMALLCGPVVPPQEAVDTPRLCGALPAGQDGWRASRRDRPPGQRTGGGGCRCEGGGERRRLGAWSGPPRAQMHLGWAAFAARYRAELDALPEERHRSLVRQLAWWLRMYPTVTLLSFERVRGGEDEEHARSQRRILRDWLLRRPLSA